MEIAIITGASSGLGKEFFRAVTAQYPQLDSVWLIARRTERLEELAKDSPVPVQILSLDLAEADSYAALGDRLQAEQPQVKILINNAGLGKLGNMAECDCASQIRMVDVNCRGLTGVTTTVLPYMHKGSFLVNVASIAAFAPNTRMSVYSATKAYVLSLTKSLREELKPLGINALAVCPGPMETEFLEVAKITGQSRTFETLPYCKADVVAAMAVRKAAKGRAVYTNRFFFKFYRVVAKLLPHNLVMQWAKT